MNGFERRKEQNRDRIRQAALELFKVHGIKKVSVSDIAGKADVSPATIYNHFGGKEELVREVVKWLFRSVLERYELLLQEERPFVEKLQMIVFDKAEVARRFHGEVFQAMWSSDPEMKAFVDQAQQKATQLVLALLEDGKRQGFVNRELSDSTIVAYIDVFYSFVLSRYSISSDGEENARLVRELSALLLYGLVGDSGHIGLLTQIEKER